METVEAGSHVGGRAIDGFAQRKRRMHVLIRLHEGEEHAKSHRESKAVYEPLPIAIEQRMVRPGYRGTRKKQDDRVVERQVERIQHLGALWWPHTACKGCPCDLLGLVRKEAGVKEGPEPRNEEHQLRGDEHDHAITEMQPHHTGMMAFMRFLDGIRPPREHRVEDDQNANRSEERRVGKEDRCMWTHQK